MQRVVTYAIKTAVHCLLLGGFVFFGTLAMASEPTTIAPSVDAPDKGGVHCPSCQDKTTDDQKPSCHEDDCACKMHGCTKVQSLCNTPAPAKALPHPSTTFSPRDELIVSVLVYPPIRPPQA